MLNAEKYKKEISECIDEYKSARFSISEDCAPSFKYCDATYCNDCMLSGQEGNCSLKRMKWLLSEYKEPIKLTKLEYDILTYILKNTECRYITRNKSRSLCVHSCKTVKDTQYGQWTAVCDKVKSCEVFNNLFPFIKWEDSEPTSIQDVLDKCAVENKEEQ